eukprot:TRINITY_DN870_c0_g1_i7.p3 TRINITY_DN870_c0_g1~~TRINITY_DN870_c0_g1_i7.p3  ORF type:complete len:324 (+),score=43.68 TRINITY_DN870_c0_g1_i7:1497-2468(+)
MSEVDHVDMAPEKIQQLLESQLYNLERAKKLDPKFEEQVEKKRKQNTKDIKQILKNEKLSLDQKLNDLRSKSLKLVEEVSKCELEVAREVTICEGIKVHRDKLLKEFNKSEALCNKLQQLCRELQKQNSSIIEKTEKSCKQEACLRDQLKEDFQQKLDVISEKVAQQGNEKEVLLAQNKELQQKLDDILQGYSQTENQVKKFCEARETEKQLANLQLEQQSQICSEKDEELKQYKVRYESMLQQFQANSEELQSYRTQYENIQSVVNDAKQMVINKQVEYDAESLVLFEVCFSCDHEWVIRMGGQFLDLLLETELKDTLMFKY